MAERKMSTITKNQTPCTFCKLAYFCRWRKSFVLQWITII